MYYEWIMIKENSNKPLMLLNMGSNVYGKRFSHMASQFCSNITKNIFVMHTDFMCTCNSEASTRPFNYLLCLCSSPWWFLGVFDHWYNNPSSFTCTWVLVHMMFTIGINVPKWYTTSDNSGSFITILVILRFRNWFKLLIPHILYFWSVFLIPVYL